MVIRKKKKVIKINCKEYFYIVMNSGGFLKYCLEDYNHLMLKLCFYVYRLHMHR